MDRLEKRSATRMNVSGGGQAQAAGELRAEVADDVTEEVARNNDVELAWIADHLHGQRINIKVAGFDFGVLWTKLLEDALPEVMSEGHGVGLIAHAEAPEAIGASVVEGVADDALDALPRVNVFLDGDFVGGSLLEKAAHADIEAFRIFPENHEANIFFRAAGERSKPRVQEFDGPGVDEEVELEAEAKEDVSGMLIRGDTGITEGAEQDGVELAAQHFDRARRKTDAIAQVAIGAPVKFDKLDGAFCRRDDTADDVHGNGGHFPADAIAGNHGNAGRRAASAERELLCGAFGSHGKGTLTRAAYQVKPPRPGSDAEFAEKKHRPIFFRRAALRIRRGRANRFDPGDAAQRQNSAAHLHPRGALAEPHHSQRSRDHRKRVSEGAKLRGF